MRKPLTVLFVTYSADGSNAATAFIGVLKRCIRLISHLPLPKMDVHLVNFGILPSIDPLVREISSKIPIHKEPFGARELFKIKPEVVITGEGPGIGKMMELSMEAARLNIPQICIENAYSRFQFRHFIKSSPQFQQWLLIGLPFGNRFGRISHRVVLVPPLLGGNFHSYEREFKRADITILGYDRNVVERGIEFVNKLPANFVTRLILSRATHELFFGANDFMRHSKIILSCLPSDALLKELISTSALVVCKSGFQQMIECLALGTPVLAYNAPGGVPQELLAQDFRPFIRYFPREKNDWDQLSPDIMQWLRLRPMMPWGKVMGEINDPVKFGANWLYNLIFHAYYFNKSH